MELRWEAVGMHYEKLGNKGIIWRCKVPGGWLLRDHGGNSTSITFYPDPDHIWNGCSLP